MAGGDGRVVVGLLADIPAGREGVVKGNAARLDTVRVATVDKVVTVLVLGALADRDCRGKERLGNGLRAVVTFDLCAGCASCQYRPVTG